ncbi:MAG: peptide chain release factor N(5)-glutamine methyltransferase [Candidatus Bruticola sp.]
MADLYSSFPNPPRLEQVLRWGKELLLSGGFSGSEARRECEILVGALASFTEAQLFTQSEMVLPDDICAKVAEGLQRRLQGEPVAYILGRRGFYGFTFSVGAGVLIPRPETELLVDTVINWIDQFPNEGGANSELMGVRRRPRILDLCTGSGCVALTIKALRLEAVVEAQDISERTYSYFAENRRNLQLEDRVAWHGGDLFERINSRFNFIVANPPYIGTCEGPKAEQSVALYEPSLALFSGSDGLDLIKRLVSLAPAYLEPGGSLALEIGCNQGEAVASLMSSAGFKNVTILKDFNNLDRVVCGHRRQETAGFDKHHSEQLI